MRINCRDFMWAKKERVYRSTQCEWQIAAITGVLTEATELNAFYCEWLISWVLSCGWHCSRYWKKAEIKSSGGWGSRRSKKRLAHINAGEVGGGVRVVAFHLCAPAPSLPPSGGPFSISFPHLHPPGPPETKLALSCYPSPLQRHLAQGCTPTLGSNHKCLQIPARST